MVEYNSLLITGLTGFGAGVITTLALVLLVVIYNNIKSATAESRKEEEDQGMIVPLSSLLGGGGGGPPISMADIMKLKAAMAAQGMPPQPGDEKKTDASVGNYI